MGAKEQWECDHCQELHDSEWEAEDCCRPEVHRVWVCEKCEDVFDSKEEAEKCCDGDDAETYNSGLVFPPQKFAHNPDAYIAEFHKLNGLIP